MTLKSIIDAAEYHGHTYIYSIRELCNSWEYLTKQERIDQYNEALIEYPERGAIMSIARELLKY